MLLQSLNITQGFQLSNCSFENIYTRITINQSNELIVRNFDLDRFKL